MADPRRISRREQYAEETRQAIVDAARKLFAERGFFATKVDDIAAEARVSPATVYAVAGGKQGLLDELVRIWSTDPAIEGARQRISAATSGREIITITGDASRAHSPSPAPENRRLTATIARQARTASPPLSRPLPPGVARTNACASFSQVRMP